ncbi:MAG: SH3 domain-containing C40 family peptidase [Eubacteriales bacterium]|nr:C40 family peptidase [Clostridiales bacterium]MDY3071788.1 SH3 domain-containing C40 family peptidase [Eubacteriales bacterium]MDY3285723.1 SH3 domain-containing C40 family peptidase [Eubacteriales bacterium]MDY5016174.1 SH3 domain-containing C40 family peptidase [Eubacteriales bacterium]
MTESNSRGGRRVLRTLLAAVVMAAALAVCSFALEGTVDASILNVRSETSVKSGIVTKIARGDNVEILSRFGNWYKINAGGKTGFVFVDYIDFDEDIYVEIGFGVVSASSASSTVNIRMEPSVEGERVTRLLSGTKVRILGYTDGWYYVRYAEYVGYISADYLKVYGVVYGPSTANDPDALDPNITEDLPNSSNYATIEETISPADVVQALEASPTTSERTKIVEYAMTFIGTRYVYGGASPSTGFDCSGFTQYVFKNFGYSLNRSSAAQIKNGTSISKDELRPGDLVFFSRAGYAVGHVGIYVGDNSFIHAPSTGDYVKISSLDEAYYLTRYVGARRIVSD